MGSPLDNPPRAGLSGPPPGLTRGAAAALALALATLASLALPAPGDAQSVAELTSKTADARHRAEALAGEIEAQTAALAAKRRSAAAAAAREAELTATLEAGRQRAAALAAEVAQARERLRRTRATLRRNVAALADRMVTIYKAGGPDALGLLLSSEGYDALAVRVEYLERIQAADEALIERARALQTEVAAGLAAVADARRRQEAHNSELAAAREGIAAARAQAEARAAALAGARSTRELALGELQSQIRRWEQQVREAQQVSAAEAEQQVADWVKGWAIPQQIVMCESGGNFEALNPSSGAGGAYQILPSTWKLYGGKGLPHQASPKEQSEIAAQIWADSGSSAWVCAG